ncbi:MAG: aminotransferase class IV [Aquidulcibacter sp.]|uniref:aminotransferase class IV n=1 Tax=Aquidulcibacter sp. TaxID=2052990 RepID=UPI0022BA8FC4|nr:aminotransferase class IV [Aquidulcibacter sp.]MCZ8207566.1 aminotransferase class IV [Aquidulcibacter sp.]
MTDTSLGKMCWHNGQLVEITKVRVDPTDRGFTLGDGLFETLLWTGQEIRFFEDHMARLGHGAHQLGLALPFNVAEIEGGLLALAAASRQQPAALRLMVSRGTGPRGLKIPDPTFPNILATITAVPAVFPAVDVRLVDIYRSAGAPSARFKTLSYVDNIVALNLAQAQGADDGLMRGPDGSIACATSSNLMILRDGKWFTPPLADGALPGIVRGRLVRAGLVTESRVQITDLDTCQTACLTNALVGVRLIHTLNGRALYPELARFAELFAVLK